MSDRILGWLLCVCLLTVLTGCGNKGPLVLPETQQDEEEEQKSRSNSSY